ncbi:MAG: hypothetical protein U1F43_07765 [Myxococcota bacterium]
MKVADAEAATGKVKTAAREMSDGIQTYYFGGKADPGHDQRARELPAYEDGKASYVALAQGVLKKGEQLRAASQQPSDAPSSAASESSGEASQKKGENDG